MKNETEKTSKIFTGAIIALVILLLIMLTCMIGYGNSIKNIQHNNQQLIVQTLKNLEIKNTKNEIFEILIKENNSDKLNKITNEQYNDFLIKYNENQSNWLNIWLTILGIALAFIGLIAPLCFMKLYEDKKAEMDKIIEEARQQKDKAELSVQKMEEQLQEVNNQSKKMSEDLATVKKYVNEAQSLAKYAEGLNKEREDKKEEAENLYKEAIQLNPQNDDALDRLGCLYGGKKDFTKAIEYLEKAIAINPTAVHYNNMSSIQDSSNNIPEAIKYELLALEKAVNDNNRAFYNSILSYLYSKQKNTDKTLYYLNEAHSLSSAPKVMCNCCVALINIKKYKDAIEQLKVLIKINPSATNYYNLTEAYIFDKQITEALKTIKIYITKQNNRECQGIYTDDFEKWIATLQQEEETPTIKELIEIINSLEKRER